MEHKHTPGPWMAVGDYVFGGEDESFESVCLLKNTIYSNSKEANGRLIAVAPELLEALAYIVAMEGTEENEWDAVERVIPEICAKARTAIAKATGSHRMTIKRNIEVEVDPTPQELAELFWKLGSIEQAEFFNKLGEIAGHHLPFQMQYVTDDDVLTTDGRYAMSIIGIYSEAQNG